MANLKFADTHNMVAFLSKPEESDGFEQIVDFLNAQPIKYALTVNPTIYTSCIEQFWSTVKAKTINREVPLHALVDDKAVHKELGGSLVRTATTASSLEAEHDSGGPMCQETMGDTIAQTRFENVSKHSNDTLLARGNTLRSGDDNLKLTEMMELCTNLQTKVLDLEKTKTTQANEIASLNESSGDEDNLGEDASKQGRRINDIDADDDITLVNVQDDADNEMFDADVLDGEEVFVANKENDEVNVVEDAAQVNAVGNVVSTVGAATTVSAATITTDDDGEITLAQALIEMKSTKPKVKGIVFQEPSKSTTTTISSQLSSQDKGKGIMMEPEKPIKKKDQISFDKETALKLQAEFDEEERLAREKAEKEQEANIALIETWDDIQAKINVDHQLAELSVEELSVEEKAKLFQQLLEQRRKHFVAKRAEEKRNKPPTQAQQRKIMCTYLKNMESFDSIQKLFNRAFKRVDTFVDFRTDLVEGSSKRAREKLKQESTKKQKVDKDKDTAELQSLYVDGKIHKEGKKSYYQIVRADGKSQMYKVFSQMLKSFTREDLEDLYKLELLKVLEWKLYDSCGLHSLRMQHVYIHLLVEKKYPRIPSTITDMLNKKLQGRIVGIKSLLNAASITAAHIRVNAAQLFNAAEGVNAASEEVSTAELVSTAYANEDLAKFRGQNLEMYKLYYDPLFRDTVAVGDRSKLPLECILVDEDEEHQEGKGDSDDMNSYDDEARWAILKDMHVNYPYETQVDIVIASMALHNYIRMKDNTDDAFYTAQQDTYNPNQDCDTGGSINEMIEDTCSSSSHRDRDNDLYMSAVRYAIVDELLASSR
ncbi:hypothetical protein Tco_0710271 [Tanacetum coccineum]